MAGGGDRNATAGQPRELDSAFRDAVLRPWRAAPRTPPAPPADGADSAQPSAELTSLRRQLTAAQDELGVERLDRARERAAWDDERQRLQQRIDELVARPGLDAPAPPALADLARGIDSLTDRMRSLAARRDARP